MDARRLQRREFLQRAGRSAIGVTCCAALVWHATGAQEADATGKGRKKSRGMAYCGIDCDACKGCVDGCTGENISAGCAKCKIRACARERKVEFCAYCPDYSCAMLDKHLDRKDAWAVNARKYLEGLRAAKGLPKRGTAAPETRQATK